MSAAYTNNGKATSVKRNSARKSKLTSWYIEKDCFEKSHNYCSIGYRAAEPSTIRLQLPNILLQKVIFRCINDGVTTTKPGHQTTGNARVTWSVESSFTLFPASGRVYVWKTHNEAYNPECLVPTVKHG
jgi:hypothetical protein